MLIGAFPYGSVELAARKAINATRVIKILGMAQMRSATNVNVFALDVDKNNVSVMRQDASQLILMDEAVMV